MEVALKALLDVVVLSPGQELELTREVIERFGVPTIQQAHDRRLVVAGRAFLTNSPTVDWEFFAVSPDGSQNSEVLARQLQDIVHDRPKEYREAAKVYVRLTGRGEQVQEARPAGDFGGIGEVSPVPRPLPTDYAPTGGNVPELAVVPSGSGKTQSRRISETLTGEAKALALLAHHPDWTDKRIAEAVPCARTTLYTWKRFVAGREAMKQHARPPRGWKGRESSRIEAVDD